MGLDAREQSLIRVSVLGTRPDFVEAFRSTLHELAAGSGTVRREELYECCLMLQLFAGFPAAIEAARTLQHVWPSDVAGSPRDADADVAEYNAFAERGFALFQKIYGKNAELVSEQLLKISPELARAALVEGYGRTLARPALDSPTRELVIIGILTQLGWDRQLYSHLLGAKNLSVPMDKIAGAIELGAMGEKRMYEKAMSLLERA